MKNNEYKVRYTLIPKQPIIGPGFLIVQAKRAVDAMAKAEKMLDEQWNPNKPDPEEGAGGGGSTGKEVAIKIDDIDRL